MQIATKIITILPLFESIHFNKDCFFVKIWCDFVLIYVTYTPQRSKGKKLYFFFTNSLFSSL